LVFNQKWKEIYDLWETKRANYRQQWKEIVLAKAENSKLKMILLTKNPKIEPKPKIPKKKERFILKREPAKPLTVVEKPKIVCTPKPDKKTIFPLVGKINYEKPKIVIEKGEMPALRRLHIDQEVDFGFWKPKKKASNPKKNRMIEKLMMCDNILKFKSNSAEFIARNSGAMITTVRSFSVQSDSRPSGLVKDSDITENYNCTPSLNAQNVLKDDNAPLPKPKRLSSLSDSSSFSMHHLSSQNLSSQFQIPNAK
jgi:hypothetical protein